MVFEKLYLNYGRLSPPPPGVSVFDQWNAYLPTFN